MKRTLAYKYQLKTNSNTEHILRQCAGAQRFVWNRILAYQNERYRLGEKKLSYVQCANLLPFIKREGDTNWLKDMPSQTLQQTLKDLDRAYTNFFQGRAELPRFKKRGDRDSFRYPDAKQIKLDQDNSRIFLPKLGYINYRNSQKFDGEINSVTVSRDADKWFVAINVDQSYEVANEAPFGSSIGIDVGIAKFAALSDGSFVEAVNSFRKYEKKTIKLSRHLSHKVKFSSNWKKAKAKLSRHHSKISHIRKDFLHQTTTHIANNYQTVAIEDLKVSNMSKSAKGTIDQKGTNVKAKSGLNKSILDQGWFEFRRQLEYKLNWRGGQLIAVNPRYTSQGCSECGNIQKDNRESQAVFVCKACGYEDNADTNAAKNILRFGLSLENSNSKDAHKGTLRAGFARSACEVNHTSGQQQEPAQGLSVVA